MKYGLLNYRSGLQKAFNICKDSSDISMMGYWKLDEASGNIIDHSGNGYDLTANNTPTYQQDDYLSMGRALTFASATSEYLNVTDKTGLNLADTVDSVWLIILKSTSKGSNKGVIHKRAAGPGYSLYVANATGKLTLYLDDNVDNATITGAADVADSAYHLAGVVLDRSGNGQLYLDGSTDGAAVNISAVNNMTNNRDFWIGRTAAGGEYYDGSVAELLMIKGATSTLPAWALGATFQANVYNWALNWPLNTMRKLG